jgi:hypothetical protein
MRPRAKASGDALRLRHFVSGLAAAAWLALAPAAPAAAQALPAETVLRHFEQFALTTFGPQEKPAVVKWDGPGVVLLDGRDVTAVERKIIAVTLAELSRATGHAFHLAGPNENASVLLGFIAPFGPAIQGRYKDLFNRLFRDPMRHIELLVKSTADGRANCVYRPAVADFRVIGGIVLVKPGLPETKLRKCLTVFLGKITGMLGNARKADAPAGPGMDQDRRHDRFNALDREIAPLLYLPDLKPGMRRDEAIAVVRKHLQ